MSKQELRSQASTIEYIRKHGIFNNNTANSVRAAITLLKKSDDKKGFKITPMIRFKNEERNKLLKCKVLYSYERANKREIP